MQAQKVKKEHHLGAIEVQMFLCGWVIRHQSLLTCVICLTRWGEKSSLGTAWRVCGKVANVLVVYLSFFDVGFQGCSLRWSMRACQAQFCSRRKVRLHWKCVSFFVLSVKQRGFRLLSIVRWGNKKNALSTPACAACLPSCLANSQ